MQFLQEYSESNINSIWPGFAGQCPTAGWRQSHSAFNQHTFRPITHSMVSDLEHYRIQLEEVNQAIQILMPEFDCTLMAMPGIDLITAANMLSGIGNISRFPNAAKLAKFAGIAPVNFSSAGKGKDMCPKQGNRRLQAIFYFLAIQVMQVSINGTPKNPVFREHYLRKLEDGKNKQQVLICITRRLVNIVYGMLKNHTEYREPGQ